MRVNPLMMDLYKNINRYKKLIYFEAENDTGVYKAVV